MEPRPWADLPPGLCVNPQGHRNAGDRSKGRTRYSGGSQTHLPAAQRLATLELQTSLDLQAALDLQATLELLASSQSHEDLAF